MSTPIDALKLKQLIDAELPSVLDSRVADHIRSLLIEPAAVLRAWDYGAPGEQYVCWTVLEHRPSNTGIAFCESGFGPVRPWGLVFLSGEHMSIGMDSGWYSTFLQAYYESMAVSDLAIWRVFKTDRSGRRQAISEEGDWDTTWKQVDAYRKADPSAKYDCDTDANPNTSG